MMAKLPYEHRDFAPITRIGMPPNIIIVHPSTPFKSIKEFDKFIRAEIERWAQVIKDAGIPKQ